MRWLIVVLALAALACTTEGGGIDGQSRPKPTPEATPTPAPPPMYLMSRFSYGKRWGRLYVFCEVSTDNRIYVADSGWAESGRGLVVIEDGCKEINVEP